MRKKLLYKVLLIIGAMVMICESGHAQQDTFRVVTITHTTTVKSLYLRLGGGFGYGNYRDKGTAPISFNGVDLLSVAGLQYECPLWDYSIDIISTAGVYEDALDPMLNFSAYNISNTLRIKASRDIISSVTYDLMLGFAITNFAETIINTNYENAAVGISDFLGPEIVFRTKLHPLALPFTLHAEADIMPVARVYRPGYSYIYNYTASQPVIDAMFDNYQWQAKAMASTSTDIGIDFYFGSYKDNRLSISYLWSFRTNGNEQQWAFHHASHILAIDLIISLKHKIVCKSDYSEK